jgi:hypothetical protein
MSRTRLTATPAPGDHPQVASWLTFTDGDPVNGNDVLFTKRLLVRAKNTGAVNRTCTILSVEDNRGRKDDATYTIPPGDILECGPFTTAGFAQTDGTLWIDVSHADVELNVLELEY